MSEDGINPAIWPVGIPVFASPLLPEGAVLVVDPRALVRDIFRILLPELPEDNGSSALAAVQFDHFRASITKDLHDIYVTAFDHTCSEAARKPRIVYCIQCGKRRHASRRRCVKCKRRSW